jgi:SAM-dependent methyltransferase
MVFSDYANFYDLYYTEKDYPSEVNFVLELASRFGNKPETVLDMGCGTGRHMEQFVKKGLKCDGFDLSPEMLAQARQRLAGKDVTLTEGNLITFENGKKYDLVIAMFAVMGYLTENEQLLAGLRTAFNHLNPEGIFVFDGWFGPAVLVQKPQERHHQYLSEKNHVERSAIPSLDPVRQTVTINYNIVLNRDGVVKQQISEEHIMRFMFVKEMELAMKVCGLELVHYCPFMEQDKNLTTVDWNVTMVARRKV